MHVPEKQAIPAKMATAVSIRSRGHFRAWVLAVCLTDEAICEFQEAIPLKPDYAEAHDNLARILTMKNVPAAH
jgi:hypothetical protein